MRKTWIYIIVSLLICFYINVSAQSRKAYLKAGEKCIEAMDYECALRNVLIAQDYFSDNETDFLLGECYLQLNDFYSALPFYIKCAADSSDEKRQCNCQMKQADVLRRLNRMNEALNSLASDRCKNDSLLIVRRDGLKNLIDHYPDTVSADIKRLMPPVNSTYSDFNPLPISDSLFYFTSKRFRDPNDVNNTTSEIIKTNLLKDQPAIEKLSSDINQSGQNNSNVSISEDRRILIFTRCKETSAGKLKCDLYESEFKSGNWQKAHKIPQPINADDFTTTQPCITVNPPYGYTLYFISDRPGGSGQTDIWLSQRDAKGIYQDPVVLSEPVNSIASEMTPFVLNGKLSFSSDRENTLGGFDIYIADTGKVSNMKIIHPGYPLNSNCNDLYYSGSFSDSLTRYFVSNRPEKINSTSCCYDIFSLKYHPAKPLATDSMLTAAKNPHSDSLTVLNLKKEKNSQEEFLPGISFPPIRLYFDNDYPDPRSSSPKTKADFEKLNENYTLRKKDYLMALEKYPEQKAMLTAFFDDSISNSNQRLEAFSEVLADYLQKGYKVKITVQGTASPLASERYNLTLSERRINSVLNFWFRWRQSMMSSYINDGNLTIIRKAGGESFSKKTVSDDPKKQFLSVYSLDASIERRIEITGFEVEEKK